ncbi:DNA polymerase-3 subunit epsilon [Litoreibacter meonggei]|uniref:DNA-directed DNA polymerase n=1 Tax=Litoreibacter meonggei TaxID=1049199 RepID=A0A497WTA0_9RHOB|nr:exonuclease domain-containing protein [Litoreibacter meonggei]RLJ59937.1 DNA polymerase-3 subunit epsilon [Litoreibacter meonggei]
MTHLSLRLRIFLFFCLIGIGGIVVVLGALWLGYRQLGNQDALSAFTTVAIVAAFGLLALATFIWRLFDENVSKPIEHLAAQFRVHANADINADIDAKTAQYLGDLAPAASAIRQKLEQANQATAETVAQKTARLERQRAQLLRILSDIPVAVIVATQDHQIVLYDGQAAELMECEAPARLNGSVFDYLEESVLREILSQMEADGTHRREIAIKGRSGANYSGHIRLFEAGAGYTLMLEPLAPYAERPLVYDFDLLQKSKSTDPNDTALRDLTFVVFDSETTGLDPNKDDVVQLGAIRVVNGKIIATEVFETLVNPGRPIPPSSTKVHHINDGMVAEAPPFSQARAAFHRFSRGAVIVAHNAPFDMAFLHRDTAAEDLQFDNPILDTVHLSAVVFGGSAEHTLDAICDRLDVEIPTELRHTALGDAMATAQILVALLPILEARGLCSFGAVQAEVRKHIRILKVQD